MSIIAILPAANLIAANAALETAGFGPSNFSVVSFTGGKATHAALHAWHDPAFVAAVKAIAGVVYAEGTGDPVARTKTLIEAQGAKWGAQAPALPTTGNATAGTLYAYNRNGTRELWHCIQTINRAVYGAAPETYSAHFYRVREPGVALPWSQPPAENPYKLVNPFTGKADTTLHGGKTWRTKVDINVWEPTAQSAQWEEIDAQGNVIVPAPPPAEEWPAWKPWTGINADLYQVGAKVSHAGKRWVGNTPNNHWKPGTYGWTQQP